MSALGDPLGNVRKGSGRWFNWDERWNIRRMIHEWCRFYEWARFPSITKDPTNLTIHIRELVVDELLDVECDVTREEFDALLSYLGVEVYHQSQKKSLQIRKKKAAKK
jgi:hypothetical protein